MAKITIVDGNSLLFRAYFATAYPGVEIMRSQDGTPTNAIFAFSNMINKIINDMKPDEAIFVAFDAGKHNFRHDALQTYKANRKPTPEDLVKQFPLVRQFLKSMGIYQFEQEGFEGDDIAGTIAKTAEKQGYEVHLFTSDRDFLQLVDNNISVHIIKKGMSDIAIMTPELVKQTYGFDPIQIIDYKGLRGDTSDNLPGIPGIGDKGAVKLINEYGSFDNIVAHANEIKGKLGENIKNNYELGKLSRDLAIIKTDVPLPFTINETIYKGYNFKKISEFCSKYGLKQFISKVSPKWKRKDFSNDAFEYKEVSSLKSYSKPTNLGIALDFDNDDYTNSEILGVGLSFDENDIYLNFTDAIKDFNFLDWLIDKNVKKYCYDFKALKVALSKVKLPINGLFFDILLASYLLDSSIKNSPEVVFNLFGADLSNQENDSNTLFSTTNPSKTCKIAHYSLLLEEKISSELEKIEATKVYKEVELPLSIVLAKMEIEGFPLSKEKLDELGNIFKPKANQLEKEIYDMAGEKFNLASPKQVGEILFNKLGLTSNKKLSTSFEMLNDIKHEHPIIEKIIEYRKYFKLITTYVEGLKNHIHNDGKIYAKFNQALTTTGRLSSSDPNLQNITVRDDEAKLIRKAFFYPNNEFEILSLDYSQIELRILASLSNCAGLKEIFNNNEDIHSGTARKIFNLQGEVSTSYRRKAKTVNFGIVYGISDWGLAEQLEIPVNEAKNIISSFYSSFPEIGTFFQNIISEATKKGYVSTILGRKRYIRELFDANYQVREFAKRAAMNAPIQGSAADLIKIAMIKVDKALQENNMKSKMVLQIHDELIFKVYKDEKEQLITLVKNIMESALSLDIPLKVDGGFGDSWYDAK